MTDVTAAASSKKQWVFWNVVSTWKHTWLIAGWHLYLKNIRSWFFCGSVLGFGIFSNLHQFWLRIVSHCFQIMLRQCSELFSHSFWIVLIRFRIVHAVENFEIEPWLAIEWPHWKQSVTDLLELLIRVFWSIIWIRVLANSVSRKRLWDINEKNTFSIETRTSNESIWSIASYEAYQSSTTGPKKLQTLWGCAERCVW